MPGQSSLLFRWTSSAQRGADWIYKHKEMCSLIQSGYPWQGILVETRFSQHWVGFHFDDEFLDDGWIYFLKKDTHNDFGLIVSKKTFELKQGDIVS